MAKRTIELELKRQYALKAIKWCRENMGVNKRKKDIPKISVRVYFRKDETERFIKGIYYSDENRIIVYHLNCDTIEEVISTVIHEYTHYLQSMKKYWEYSLTHDYNTHHYERQARRNETKYTKMCIRKIKREII